MNVLHTMQSVIQKRVAFVRLRRELREMPLGTAIDLGLFREDAAKIAARAIYGRD